MKRYIRSAIVGDWKGYDVCLENSGQNYYFVDENGEVHYAHLEEELKAKIDKHIADKHKIKASVDYENDEDDEIEQLILFLEDCAYETNAYSQNDIKGIDFTDEVKKRLSRYMYRYMAAMEDGDSHKLNRLGTEIGMYLRRI